MHAPHQLAVGDDAAAHAGADEEHRCVGAALQRAGPQLSDGRCLAVVFQRDGAAAFLADALSHRGAGVVQQGTAVGNIAGFIVHKARQGHRNALHFVLVGCIQRVQCVQKMLLRILRRGHGTRIRAVHLLIHHRIFDLGAANIKNHDLHIIFPPQNCAF